MQAMMRRKLASAMLALTLTATTAWSAGAQQLSSVLDQLPAGAQVVIVAPNLQNLNQKIASLSQKMGLQLPQTQDAVGLFQQQIGLQEGVKQDGAMVMAMLDLASALENQTQPTPVLFVPVSDYEAFLGNFAPQEAGEGVQEIMFGGSTSFVRQVGDYALISESQDVVSEYAAGEVSKQITQNLGGVGEQYMNQGDLLVYVDLATLGPVLKPILDAEVEQMTMMAGAGGNAQAMQSMQAMAGMYALLGEALVQDSTALLKTIELTDSGANLSFLVKGKPDSAFTRLLPGGKAKPGQLLAALPARQFIMSGAIDASAVNIPDILKNLQQAFADDDQMGRVYGMAAPLAEQTSGYSFAWYVPDQAGMMMGGFLNVLNVYQVEEPAEFRQKLKEMLQGMDGMQQPVGMAQGMGEAPSITTTTTWTDSAMNIAGTDVDAFSVQQNLPPEVMQQMGPMAPMMAMMGATGYSGYVATAAEHVLMTTVQDPQLVTAALQTVKAHDGLGKSGLISDQRQQALPSQPFAEGYLSVGGIAQVLNTFMPMLGGQPVDVPQNLPMIAAGAALQEQTLVMKLVVPAESVKFIVDTANQLQADMAGQGGGGFGGPPPTY